MDQPAASRVRDHSIRRVLEWYRLGLIHNRFSVKFLPVPAALSGWVLAEAGEFAEPDGTRPRGAVRASLLRLIDSAGLTDRENLVLGVRFGLTEYPVASAERHLRYRVRAFRKPKSEGFGERRLRDLVESALKKLDRLIEEQELEHPGQRAVYATACADPVRAEWFVSTVPEAQQPVVFEAAVQRAREFVAMAGLGPHALMVLAEIAEYQASTSQGGWPPSRVRRGVSRARAVVSVMLWDLLFERGAGSRFAPSQVGRVRLPGTVRAIPEPVGRFLSGERDDEVVFAACHAVLDLAQSDRGSARIVSELLLNAYGWETEKRLSDEAEAEVLRTAVRLRSNDNDPVAVMLARRALVDRPFDWRTIDTAQHAVRVASAFGAFAVAGELCDEVDAILGEEFRVPPGRDVAVERIDYRLWTNHQRSGTLRRQVDLTGSEDALEAAELRHESAERDYELARKMGSVDASDRWEFFLAVRAAELRVLLLKLQGSPPRRPQRHELARSLERARGVAEHFRLNRLEQRPLIQAQLRAALVAGELEEAVRLLHRLHGIGWPISRGAPEVFAVALQTPVRARAPRVLRDAVDDVAAAERDPAWQSAAGETAAGWRRAMARVRQLR
jgi:hypothetical protein